MSPSISSNKNKWKLPANPEPIGVRCISVPVPDDPEWIGKFYGAIYQLAQQIWWDRDEAHTAKIVAARWLEVYLATMAADCAMGECDDCLGRIVRDPRTGWYGFVPTGEIDFYRFPDGAWTEPLSQPVWSSPQPYTVGTDDERRCIAARNGAIALQMLYDETWGQFIDFSISTALKLGSVLLQAVSSFIQVAFGVDQLLNAINNLIDNSELFADPFPDADVQELQNILYCNSAIDEDGVVTFDFEAVLADVLAVGTSPFPGLKVLLQYFIGEDGLNSIAGIHNEDEADCSSADCFPSWCKEFDFRVDGYGWAVDGSGVRVNGQGYRTTIAAGQNSAKVTQSFAGVNFKHIEIDIYTEASSLTRSVQASLGGTSIINQVTGVGEQTITWDGDITLTGNASALITVSYGASQLSWYIREIRASGDGDGPSTGVDCP